MAKTINFLSETNVLKHSETSQLSRKIVFYSTKGEPSLSFRSTRCKRIGGDWFFSAPRRADSRTAPRISPLAASICPFIGADRSRRKAGGAFVSAWKALSSGQIPLHARPAPDSMANSHRRVYRTVPPLDPRRSSIPRFRVPSSFYQRKFIRY